MDIFFVTTSMARRDGRPGVYAFPFECEFENPAALQASLNAGREINGKKIIYDHLTKMIMQKIDMSIKGSKVEFVEAMRWPLKQPG